MGKLLIIKGADFHENAVAVADLDITSMFTFTDGQVYNQNISSVPLSTIGSAYFGTTNLVDVSAYTGRKLRCTFCAYKSSGGTQPTWRGVIFVDANGDVISSERIHKTTSGTPVSSGYTEIVEQDIPSNAKYFATFYFNNSASVSEVVPFSVKIVNQN